MTEKIKVAILYGGPSGEHEISLRSAASVIKHLNPEKYQLIPIGISKSGDCFYNPPETLLPCRESIPVNTPASTLLPGLLIKGTFVKEVDVVFPVVHGPLLEDGALQGLLELAQIPFVGSGVLSSSICMDKDITRRLLSIDNVPATAYRVLSLHTTQTERLQFFEQVLQEFGLPLFVKPCCMGSSVGIQKVTTSETLERAVEDAFRYDDTVLVEQAVQGLEIELAVLENKEPMRAPLVSVPGELKIHHPDGFYSYQAKYIDSDLTELCIPAELSVELTQELQRLAVLVFERLKCKGMARIDFFVNPTTQAIYLNEVNTLPGFTSISMYPRLWEASGLPYEALLEQLIELALTNHHYKQQRIRDYQ